MRVGNRLKMNNSNRGSSSFRRRQLKNRPSRWSFDLMGCQTLFYSDQLAFFGILRQLLKHRLKLLLGRSRRILIENSNPGLIPKMWQQHLKHALVCQKSADVKSKYFCEAPPLQVDL